jgi:metal-responsive CopG/Arc/MetJ family transcriptional regulator
MPDDLLRAIDEIVGSRGRSKFLEDAAREKLARVELAEALKATAGIAKGRRYRHWQSRETAAAWVRETRGSEKRG